MGRSRSISWWMNHLSRIHPATMALGLDRVGEVYRRLGGQPPAPRVITVAGTNGKGSSCAILTAILRAAGKRVGTFTSPHLFRFNERIAIDGEPVDDRRLIDALEVVEHARGEIELTYFEYAALAAFVCFQQTGVDAAVLEVGLGGRLDAVNVVNPDLALITNIGFDHMRWLGDTLDQIAVEKAGIFRPGQPAVCAQATAPAGLHEAARRTGVDWRVAGRDFDQQVTDRGWTWAHGKHRLTDLPRPALPGDHQLVNASGCLAALAGVGLLPAKQIVATGLTQARVAGRLWRVAEAPDVVLDVGHNPAAAGVLRRWLESTPCDGESWLVLGMLRDKAPQGFVAELAPRMDRFVFCGLPGRRGQSARQLRGKVRVPQLKATLADDPAAALDRVLPQLQPADRVLLAGSFVTVELAARHLGLASGS